MNSNDYIAFDSSNAMIRELKRKWREYEKKVRKKSTVNILYFYIDQVDGTVLSIFHFRRKGGQRKRGKHRITVS